MCLNCVDEQCSNPQTVTCPDSQTMCVTATSLGIHSFTSSILFLLNILCVVL